MSAMTDIAEALRREFAAEQRAQRVTMRNQASGLKREIGELRREHEDYHVETTRGLAHIGDQMASLEAAVDLLVAARARRAKRAALVRRAITSTPGLIGTITTIAAAAGGLIALL